MEDQFSKLAKRLQKEHCTLEQLGISMAEIRQMRDAGYRIIGQNSSKGRVYYIPQGSENASVFISGASKEPQRVKWLEISDTHAGSIHFDDVGLRSVLQKGIDEGYEEVHFSGDLCDGHKLYRGHLNNLRYWRCEDQAACLTEILMDYGFRYYACKGNHDAGFEKVGSVNPIYIIEQMMREEGKEFIYLDGMAGDLIICGVLVRMVHLDGGKAYAKSYPGQTYIRNLFDSHGEEVWIKGNKYRTRFLQFGHFHSDIQYESAGIYCTHPGNFQFANDYTIRKGLVGEQGCRFTECLIEDKRVYEYRSTFIKARR
jgi:hypothetical protein